MKRKALNFYAGGKVRLGWEKGTGDVVFIIAGFDTASWDVYEYLYEVIYGD